MYFPYLRGGMYDLLALKELAQSKLITQLVVPIVEPLKIPPLKSTVSVYIEKHLPISIIINPDKYKFNNFLEELSDIFKHNDLVYPVIIVNSSSHAILTKMKNLGIDSSKIIAILNDVDYLDSYRKVISPNKPLYTIIPDDRSYKRTVDNNNRIVFDDKFHKLPRNADYLNNDDEFFSDMHEWFEGEGYKGFGDYSIIGKPVAETSSFAPRAVAIHIVYKDLIKKHFRIHHFVSDSNSGIENIAGKYFEAVSKLKNWYNAYNYNCKTHGLSELLSHAETGYYPGLPTLKKLSIMHHLELVNTVLQERL